MKAVVMVVLWVLVLVAEAFALATLWNWFIVPVFGVANMTIIAGVGISLIVSVLSYNAFAPTKSPDDIIEAEIKSIAMALITVGVGWVVTLFA